jgi:hypothetical protein
MPKRKPKDYADFWPTLDELQGWQVALHDLWLTSGCTWPEFMQIPPIADSVQEWGFWLVKEGPPRRLFEEWKRASTS